MVFAGLTFLYLFLPTVLFLYFIAPKALKNYVLLFSSLIFYYIGEQRLLLLMLISITINYALGLLVGNCHRVFFKKTLLVVTVVINLAILGYYKYADFFISSINSAFGLSVSLLNIALPIGISFYTFQALSYVVDVYRGEAVAAKNPCTVALYISFFPQLIAGPIVRYSDIEKQLHDRKTSIEDFAYGVKRFCIGLGKKVLLANSLAELVKTATYSNEKTVVLYWLSAIAFTFQIYFDFSGYSDMAIGLCRMFGFRIDENFNYPYISSSVTEFWRRWHISLGTWFRDYVYIPLGGNRVCIIRWLINIAIVWFLTGLWHGANWNFILWGVMFGFLLVIEKLLLKKVKVKLPRGIGIVYTLFFVLIGFVIFSSNNISDVGKNLRAMFGWANLPLCGTETLYLLRNYAITFVVAMIGATPLFAHIADKLKNKPFMIIAEPIYACLLLVLSTAYLVDGSFNPFLYFRF